MPESKTRNGSPNYADAIIQTLRKPRLVLDAGQRVKFAFGSFYEMFQATPEQTLDRSVYDLGNGQWNIPALRKMLEELLPTHGEFDNYRVEHDFSDIGQRTMLLNARRLHDGHKNSNLILLAIEDVTERQKADKVLKHSEVRYRRLFEAAHDGILILNANTRKISDVNPFLTLKQANRLAA